MSDQGLAIFSPFKIALVIAFTFLAWGELTHGDQMVLAVETLVIALYLNDLYSQRKKIAQAKRLTFKEFIERMKYDLKSFKLSVWFKNFFDTSTPKAKRRLVLNLCFGLILLTPTIMNLLRLTEVEQENLLILSFVIWSIWFIKSNLKAFMQTRELGRLFFSNLGVYFLLCSLLLVL